MDVVAVNEAALAGKASAEAKFLPQLEAAYARTLRALAREAVRGLREHQPVVAAGAPKWHVPSPEEVMNLKWAIDKLLAAGERPRLRIVEHMFDSLGVAFDVRNPLVEGVLEQLGQHISNVAETTRADIMAALDEAWQNGHSITQASTAVRQASGVSQIRAEMIARTEFTAAQTGGTLAGGKALGLGYKTWLTSPGAPHPRHENYPGLNGQTVPMTGKFSVGQYSADHPSASSLPPEESVNCRCDVLMGDSPDGSDTGILGLSASTDTMTQTRRDSAMPNRVTELVEETLGAPAPTRHRIAVIERPLLAATETEGAGWRADPLYFEDVMSRDGRILAAPGFKDSEGNEFDGGFWTDTPKTLMAQFQNPESGGHALAVVAGTMPGDMLAREAGGKVTAGGTFNTDEDGQKAEEYVRNGSLTGISVDLAPQTWQIEIEPEEGGGIFLFAADSDEGMADDDEAPIVFQESVDDVVLRFTSYEVIGGTLVPTPAFGDAQVLIADGREVTVPRPGLGNIWVEMEERNGWPIPKRVVVTGFVMLDGARSLAAAAGPVIADADQIMRLTGAYAEAKDSGLLTADEASLMFKRAIEARQ